MVDFEHRNNYQMLQVVLMEVKWCDTLAHGLITENSQVSPADETPRHSTVKGVSVIDYLSIHDDSPAQQVAATVDIVESDTFT